MILALCEQNPEEPCLCEHALPDETSVTPLKHLWFVSSITCESAYEICPYSGALWIFNFGYDSTRDGDKFVLAHTRVDYQLPSSAERTVAIGEFRVETHLRQRKHAPYQLKMPAFPLEGSLFCWLWGNTGWHIREWRVDSWLNPRGYLALGAWLSFPAPLNLGEIGGVWVASPLETITTEALAVGRVFRVLYRSGYLGQLEIKAHQQVDAEQFNARCPFDWSIKLI